MTYHTTIALTYRVLFTVSKKQDFLDILTNPRLVEVKRRLDELMQAYEHHLRIEDSFELKLDMDDPYYIFKIRITTEDKQVLRRTEDWFRHHFPAREYRTFCYAPPMYHSPERWRHYYCITEL